MAYNKRILFDATSANISVPGGGSFCTKAYLEVILALYPGQVDVLHPSEAHIRDPRYNTIDIPSFNRFQYIFAILRGHFSTGVEYILKCIKDNPNQYNMVFINRGHVAGGIIRTLNAMPIRTIVLHHNFETEYQIASRTPISLFGKSGLFVQFWEKKGYQLANINLFLTQYDKNIFEKEYGPHSHNYVTGIFESTTKKQKLKISTRDNSAVITCALDHKQNAASLIHFIQYYLPLFHQILPGWDLHIMGRNPLKEIVDLTRDDSSIKLMPNPVDIYELSAQSSIYLCPMDEGGGIKLRILDGLRAGQPILLHERSARGYEDLIGEPFFVTYSDPESFKIGLKKLKEYIQSRDFSRDTIQQGYYNTFGLHSGVKKMKSILCSVTFSYAKHVK